MGIMIDSVKIVYDGSCIINQEMQMNMTTCVLIIMLRRKNSINWM